MGEHGGGGAETDDGIAQLDRLERHHHRIAFDVHDGVAQTLCSAALQLDNVESADGPEQLNLEVEMLRALLQEALREVRELIENLRPSALEAVGLEETLRAYIRDLQERTDTRVRLQMDVHGEPLTRSAQIAIFRMVQEALTNVRKHAQVNKATVLVWTECDAVHCCIADEGVGFDPANVPSRQRDRGFGLSCIRERAELLDGKVDVMSVPGKGTTVSAVIPLWR